MCLKVDSNPLAPVREAFDDVICASTTGAAPKYDSVRRILWRQRATHIPRLPQSRKDVLLEGKWAETLDGRRFAVPSDPDQMLLFASDNHLRLLAQSKTVFMDGTFTVCPSLYFQLFTIHGVVEDTVVPLAYCLLPNKTRAAYFDMLALIRKRTADMQLSFDPDTIVSDLRVAQLQLSSNSFHEPATSAALSISAKPSGAKFKNWDWLGGISQTLTFNFM